MSWPNTHTLHLYCIASEKCNLLISDQVQTETPWAQLMVEQVIWNLHIVSEETATEVSESLKLKILEDRTIQNPLSYLESQNFRKKPWVLYWFNLILFIILLLKII